MEITFISQALVIIIIGLVEVAKQLKVPSVYLPALAVALGIIASFLPSNTGFTDINLVVGIVSGLEAIGLFSGVRATITGNKK